LTDNSAVPLIVFAPQREPSEFINSLMRKAGEPVHCTWIPAVRDLGEALEQLNPELLVCAYVSESDAKQAATVRDQLAPQVPMLLVRPQISEGDIASGMRIGARDVVSLSATDRVQAVISRELRSFRLERALNSTLQSASDYRRQLQSVLQRSNDAILQVQEGIVVDANQTWLELFGYAESNTVVDQPLMDLFEDRSHAALKGALVACGQGKWTDHPLKVTALLGDGTQLHLDLVLTPGEFENEPCVRIMVPAKKRDDRQLTSDLSDAVKRDASTGLLLRRPLLDAIGARIAAPPAGGVRFMALVRPDKFAELEKDVGVRASEQLVAEYAATLKSHLGPNDIAGRLGGVSFLALLERGNTHDVEAWAEAVLARFCENTSTIGQKTVHSSCTIGLTTVPPAGSSIDAVIADVIAAVRTGRSQGGNQIFHLDKVSSLAHRTVRREFGNPPARTEICISMPPAANEDVTKCISRPCPNPPGRPPAPAARRCCSACRPCWWCAVCSPVRRRRQSPRLSRLRIHRTSRRPSASAASVSSSATSSNARTTASRRSTIRSPRWC
jgi:GGDEF domain-containing protein